MKREQGLAQHSLARWADFALMIVVAALVLRSAVRIWRVLRVIGLKIPLDPDEGWNAYHATAAMMSGSPYPAASSFMSNNYPPLSFYLVGGLGSALGDHILAGRIISFGSFVAVAAGIAFLARRFGSTLSEALFGALFFTGFLLLFSDYVGMDDPQLLAHALQMGGVAVLFSKRSRLAPEAAAALLVCGLFVKHNLIALPVAAAVWLLTTDRRASLRLTGTMLALGLAGLAAFRLSFGFDLLSRLNSSRLYSFSLLAQNFGSWIVPAVLPFAATLAGGVIDTGAPRFCAIYALVALGLGTAFLGGFGVDMNAMFDADIALSLGAALALTMLRRRTGGRRRLAVPFAGFAIVLPLMLTIPRSLRPELLQTETWLHPRRDEAEVAAEDIAWLRARPGPVMCEMLSLCYWAGKPAEVDVFNLDQQFRTASRHKESFLRALADHAYAGIQLDSSEPLFSDDVQDAILQNYRIVRTSDNGQFLVPRAP